MTTAPPPHRVVVQEDALAWMARTPAPVDSAVVTSLPDVSELPELGFARWRQWFVEAATAVIRWTPGDSVAIFYQTDIRYQGTWVDKGYLVSKAAEQVGAGLLFHKVVCRKPAGTVTQGRATYAHLLAFTMGPRSGAVPHAAPDVLADAGHMPWSKAMGVEACRLACRFVRHATSARTVVDPFCGRGTVLSVANDMGFDAWGVDVSARRCRAARTCQTALASGAAERPAPTHRAKVEASGG